MNRRLYLIGLLLLAGLFSFSLLGCEGDEDDDNNAGDDLAGIWRHTIVGVEEETVQLVSDGTLTWITAYLVDEDCFSMEGTWDADTDSITTTMGVNSSTIAYTINGNTLTITDEDGDEFVYTRISTMIDCDHYGFGGGGNTMNATLNGTVFTLGNGTAVANSGAMIITCTDLTRSITLNVDGLVAGTYDLNTGNNMATYVPLISVPADMYLAMNGMGSGTVVISSVAGSVVTGTFSFVGQHISSIATVNVTNGTFSVTLQ